MDELNQLKTERMELDAKSIALENAKRKEVVAQAVALLATVGMTCTVARAETSTKTTDAPTIPPKYRHRVTGATWSGRGRPPGGYADSKDQAEIEYLGGK